MNKSTILEYLNSGRRDEVLVITWYCFEQGKDAVSVRKFIKALQFEALYNGPYYNLLGYCYDYALTYYIQKYNIVLLHDRNGKFIKAF